MPGPGSVQHVRSERKTFHAERTMVYRPEAAAGHMASPAVASSANR